MVHLRSARMISGWCVAAPPESATSSSRLSTTCMPSRGVRSASSGATECWYARCTGCGQAGVACPARLSALLRAACRSRPGRSPMQGAEAKKVWPEMVRECVNLLRKA